MARVCREAGGRVTTNVPVRDLDLEIADRADARRQSMGCFFLEAPNLQLTPQS